jgi:hypothetical protein
MSLCKSVRSIASVHGRKCLFLSIIYVLTLDIPGTEAELVRKSSHKHHFCEWLYLVNLDHVLTGEQVQAA